MPVDPWSLWMLVDPARSMVWGSLYWTSPAPFNLSRLDYCMRSNEESSDAVLTICLILSVKNQPLTFLFRHSFVAFRNMQCTSFFFWCGRFMSRQPTTNHHNMFSFLVAYWILSKVKTRSTQVELRHGRFMIHRLWFWQAWRCRRLAFLLLVRHIAHSLELGFSSRRRSLPYFVSIKKNIQ